MRWGMIIVIMVLTGCSEQSEQQRELSAQTVIESDGVDANADIGADGDGMTACTPWYPSCSGAPCEVHPSSYDPTIPATCEHCWSEPPNSGWEQFQCAVELDDIGRCAEQMDTVRLGDLRIGAMFTAYASHGYIDIYQGISPDNPNLVRYSIICIVPRNHGQWRTVERGWTYDVSPNTLVTVIEPATDPDDGGVWHVHLDDGTGILP